MNKTTYILLYIISTILGALFPITVLVFSIKASAVFSIVLTSFLLGSWFTIVLYSLAVGLLLFDEDDNDYNNDLIAMEPKEYKYGKKVEVAGYKDIVKTVEDYFDVEKGDKNE